MRAFLHLVWFVVIFLSMLGLSALVIASFLPDPMSPQQFGYEVGKRAVWLMFLAGVMVWVFSRRGWLPGLARKPTGA